LFFPVRPHVDVSSTRAALGARDLAGERRDYVDQSLMSARIVKASGNETQQA